MNFLKPFSIVLLVSMSLMTYAQANYNLVIFSEDGMPFTAYVNAVPQNQVPMTNILITDLRSPSAVVKIVFDEPGAPELKKNLYFQEPNTEVTMRIVETKKGLRLKYFGEVPIAQAIPTQATQIVYTEVPVVISQEVVTNPVITQTTVITETTETTSDGMSDNVDVDMDISIGGVDVSMDVDINDNMGGGTYSSTTTTTTTTSTTTTDIPNDVVQIDHVYTPVAIDRSCPQVNVGQLKVAMENESFADDMLNVAMQGLSRSCAYSDEILQLAPVFSFEDDRLEFLKFAYSKVYDPQNYYIVNSTLEYSSSKEELNEFIQRR